MTRTHYQSKQYVLLLPGIYREFIGNLSVIYAGFIRAPMLSVIFIICNLRVIYTDFIRDLSGIYKWIMQKLASIVFPWSDTYDGLLASQKIMGNAYILLHMRGKFISKFLLDYISAIITQFSRKQVQLIHICTQNKRKFGKI